MKKKINPVYFLNWIVKKLRNRIRQSIRIQLITTFIACALFGFLISRMIVPIFENINKEATVDYSSDMESINWQAKFVAEETAKENTIKVTKKFIKEQNELSKQDLDALKVMVTDETGKILYKTNQTEENKINLHNTIDNVMSFSINHPSSTNTEEQINGMNKEFITFYPLKINDKNLYMFVSGTPHGDVSYQTKEGPFPFIIGIFTFIFSFFYITKRKMKQIEAMAKGVSEMTKGNLDYRINQRGQDEIALLTENINFMAEGLLIQMEKERQVKSQKNELITNVSHDLRTPLTSILGYLRLLLDEKFENEEQSMAYVKIAFSKSEQLESLIEDLFAYTKLTDGDHLLNLQYICINKFLDQLIHEITPQAENQGLLIKKSFPDELLYAFIDSEQMIRLFENLLINAINYSKDNGDIKVSLKGYQHYLEISVANQSDAFTKEELENLFERFYKKDNSRNRILGGSGLGLAIAKGIVELHEGKITAEYDNKVLHIIILLPISHER